MEITYSSQTQSRAAQYVRMSTEHQQYSPENQLDIIRQYAADHNMEIVHVYSDHGRSGLNIAGRDGLNQLQRGTPSIEPHPMDPTASGVMEAIYAPFQRSGVFTGNPDVLFLWKAAA
jgi:acetylglutamate kinase